MRKSSTQLNTERKESLVSIEETNLESHYDLTDNAIK